MKTAGWLLLALGIGLVLAAAGILLWVKPVLGSNYEPIQDSVQAMHCVQPWADSLGAGDSVYVRPTLPVHGFTFATSEACSLLAYSREACVIDTVFMHFEADECFEFPSIAADSLLVVNKTATKAFIRIWFWRR